MGTVPGPLIRVREGAPIAIDVANHTTVPEIVHWHGLHIPSLEDGAFEEGSPMDPPRGGVLDLRLRLDLQVRAGITPTSMQAITWTAPRSAENSDFSSSIPFPIRHGTIKKFFWRCMNGTDISAVRLTDISRWCTSTAPSTVACLASAIRFGCVHGERTLFRILNASATLTHTLALPGHQFLVTALDGNPVPTPTRVNTLVLGPAERVDAVVLMDQPGVWVLGEVDDAMRKSGMGIVVEYANQSGAAQWKAPPCGGFSLRIIRRRDAERADDVREVEIPLTFRSKFEGYGDFDHWTINGLSWPKTKQIPLTNGTRYRLLLDNDSNDIHPVHLHRHTFELRKMNGKPTSGVKKDVVLLPTRSRTEVTFTADHPGKTLFHCHQQDHMDSGFMMLFDYA